jgi:hypothetical protein
MHIRLMLEFLARLPWLRRGAVERDGIQACRPDRAEQRGQHRQHRRPAIRAGLQFPSCSSRISPAPRPRVTRARHRSGRLSTVS